MTIGYGSQRLGLRELPASVCLVWVGAGTLLLGIVAVSAFFTYNYARQAYAQLQPILRGGSLDASAALSVLSVGLHLLIVIPTLVIGLKLGATFLTQGMLKLMLPYQPANVPAEYGDYAEIQRGFRERVLSLYQNYPNAPLAKTLGYNTLFQPPTARSITEALARGLQRRIGGLVWGGILLAGVLAYQAFLPRLRQSLPSDLSPLLEGASQAPLLMPVIGILVFQVVLAGIEAFAIFLLVPRHQPNTVAHEGTEVYRGFGHPEQVLARLPELEIPLRWHDFLNRVKVFPVQERASSSVGDVGTFEAGALIEQQPQPIPTPGRAAGYLLLLAGWALILLSFIALLLLVYVPRLPLNNLSTPAFVTLLWFLYLAGRPKYNFNTASGFVSSTLAGLGQRMLEVYHFHSTAILIQMVGNLSRSDVRVGKALMDSIESSNVVVRSDFTARFWAADLVSEAPSLREKRYALALDQTDEAAYWLQYFRTGMHKLRSEGVRPAGVELASDEAQNIMQANVGVSALRAGGMARAQLQAAQEAQQPSQLPAGAEQPAQPGMPVFPLPVAQPAATKNCPYCGNVVRLQAKFCQSCGRSLE